MTETEALELGKCYADPCFFLDSYCQIYDAASGEWGPFRLWPAQRSALAVIHANSLSVILKARQLGMSWLCMGYALWQMIFRPAATVLIFSRRDIEALYLLSDDRLRGMYNRLPNWMKTGHGFVADSGHELSLENGSSARAFPTSAGDSYTASLAIVDEADLVPDLNRLMRAVKPTIDGGGKMILVSRVDKSTPNSEFKNIYRAAYAGTNGWTPVFLPWNVHPGRDQAWYERQKRDIQSRRGALDDLHELYPNSPTEALFPRSLDKRIPAPWLENCYVEMQPLDVEGAPALFGLEVYAAPQPGRQYVIGGDPAEGNPTSDDSALTVLDLLTGEECAALAGKLEPSTFAAAVDEVGRWYNYATVMVERNNHGHAVLLWLGDNSSLRVLQGPDGKAGWLNNSLGKTLVYNAGVEMFRDETTTLHSFDSYQQLAAIEGSTLLAPKGDRDDRADSYVLANVGRAAMMEETSNLQVLPAPNIYGSRDRAVTGAGEAARGADRGRGFYGSRR